MRALREVWKRSKSSVWGMPRDGSAASASFVRRTPPVPPPGPPAEVKVVSTSISNLRDGGGGAQLIGRDGANGVVWTRSQTVWHWKGGGVGCAGSESGS